MFFLGVFAFLIGGCYCDFGLVILVVVVVVVGNGDGGSDCCACGR